MSTKMLIDATHAEETRVVVVDGTRVEEFDFEAASRRQLAGNIYLAKVTRVEPSLQAAFVDYGGNRHGFLAFSEIHPDYYQIPVADRRALLEEERAVARAEVEGEERGAGRSRTRRKARPAAAAEDLSVAEDAPDMAAADGDDANAPAATEAMPVIDPDTAEPGADAFDPRDGDGDKPYAAVDHATELDDQIESIADEDVADEIRAPRRPRARRYKIQEVIKVRQVLLVQVVKEERGNKGAALTTYLSLAGRYCVLMPNTARGGGISRKITNAADRKKLKEIAAEIEVPDGAGLIIRTAGARRTKAEIKRDYEYLMRLWEQVRELTLKSIAPAPIYEEGNLIKRSIRDLYSRDIEEVLVEGDTGYRVAKDFMKMIMPSHAKNVRQYADPMPLFARYQVESYLAAMFNPVVQLKSGGYIVIGITEALVAIDVNSGRATKEGSIEETALKTNLEAAEEIARQLRLRDLAGLIVIDFIDMEERKNNAAVEKKLKDKLKNDRARIQVGRISGFGLLEMSRQRLRPGMLEATTQPCPHCHGTGLIRSDDSQALAILRQLEEEGCRRRSREVLLKAPVGIVNFLINQKREHVAQIEARFGMAVRLEADASMVSPDFSIEKFKTATRPVAALPPVVSVDTSTMPAPVVEEAGDEDEAEGVDTDIQPADEGSEGSRADGGARRKRRRRRRRRGGGGDEGETAEAGSDVSEAPTEARVDGDDAGPVSAEAGMAAGAEANDGAEAAAEPQPVAADTAEGEGTPRKRGTRRRSRRRSEPAEAAADAPTSAEATAESAPAADGAAAETGAAGAETPVEPAPSPRPSRRAPRRRAAPAQPEMAQGEDGAGIAATLPAAPADVPADGNAEAQAEQPGASAAGGQAAQPETVVARDVPVAPEHAEAAPQPGVEVQPVAVAQAPDPQPVPPAQPSAEAPATGQAAAAQVAGDEVTAADARAEPALPPKEEPAQPAEAAAEASDDDDAARPRRRGWWALRR